MCEQKVVVIVIAVGKPGRKEMSKATADNVPPVFLPARCKPV